jgi:hypothetical protein
MMIGGEKRHQKEEDCESLQWWWLGGVNRQEEDCECTEWWWGEKKDIKEKTVKACDDADDDGGGEDGRHQEEFLQLM